eukprot:TRINITY_DN1023_c0_g3_i1.p1 TRINITY_DN1023_c0_g3~~TRINITY_DN1023_c0_g3_i1.p1  ORF type:complete len:121 (-),score=19.82 TRINITY_DN1023_c0_g3_i1:245-607(-)
MSSANKKQVYDFQPGFHSNLHGIGVQADGIGIIDSNLKTVGIWNNNLDVVKENTSAYDKGVIYYIQEDDVTGDEIVGCLLWNSPEYLKDVRMLLADREMRSVPSSLLDLKKKLILVNQKI